MVKAKPRKLALPKALVDNARSLASKRTAELRARGRTLLATIHEKRRLVMLGFYEMGEALRELSQGEIHAALGYATFDALLAGEALMSPTSAAQLIGVAERVREEDALRWLQDKSVAVAALKKLEGVREIRRNVLLLPTRAEVDLEKASTQEIRQAAKSTRHARQGSAPTRGRTTTPTERKTAERLQAGLHKHGIGTAEVRCVATKPGATSDVIIRLPIDKLQALAAALKTSP